MLKVLPIVLSLMLASCASVGSGFGTSQKKEIAATIGQTDPVTAALIIIYDHPCTVDATKFPKRKDGAANPPVDKMRDAVWQEHKHGKYTHSVSGCWIALPQGVLVLWEDDTATPLDPNDFGPVDAVRGLFKEMLKETKNQNTF